MDSPEEIRGQLRSAHDSGGGLTEKGRGKPSPQMLGLLNGKLQEIFAGDDAQRISLLRWLWGVESSKELTHGQVKVMLDWLIDPDIPWAQNEAYVLSPTAKSTCHAIIAAYCEERGQMRLL